MRRKKFYSFFNQKRFFSLKLHHEIQKMKNIPKILRQKSRNAKKIYFIFFLVKFFQNDPKTFFQRFQFRVQFESKGHIH